jgi:hypothetical protein
MRPILLGAKCSDCRYFHVWLYPTLDQSTLVSTTLFPRWSTRAQLFLLLVKFVTPLTRQTCNNICPKAPRTISPGSSIPNARSTTHNPNPNALQPIIGAGISTCRRSHGSAPGSTLCAQLHMHCRPRCSDTQICNILQEPRTTADKYASSHKLLQPNPW